MEKLGDGALWTRLLYAEEIFHEYYADRSELPGVTLFTCPRSDAPEFDLAQIYRVPGKEADATLRGIVRHYRNLGRRPRIRLTPISEPADWAARLAGAGFVDSGERRVFLTVPETAQLVANPAVAIRRVATLEDADRFSAVQMAGFDVPPEHHEWDRTLARRHYAEGRHTFYLASLDGETVGASSCAHLAGGFTYRYGLATLPAARGHGVATSLIRRGVDDARAAGSRVIFCTANPESYATGLYHRLGFVSLFEVQTFEQR